MGGLKEIFWNIHPQQIKELVFEKYGVVNAPWIETGTFLGKTTNFLRERYPHVHSIEPEIKLYNGALKRFHGKNVTLYNDVSENVLPKLLKNLLGDVKFLGLMDIIQKELLSKVKKIVQLKMS